MKYVPKECCVGKERQKISQYTLIDECTRERFLYAFEEKNSYTTLLFLKRALLYFGYLPEIIQTDNGTEFVKHREGNPTHLMQRFCDTLGIEHKPIRPYTPRHNGKVERLYRNDTQRFYSELSFYDLDDLNHQMKLYLKRSNRISSVSF